MSDNIKTRPYVKSIDEWMDEMAIPANERGIISSAGVIVLPAGYRDSEIAFASGVYDFLAYVKEQGLFSIEVCCADGQYTVMELCSSKLRLGRFLLTPTVAGTLFLNVLGAYIYDQTKNLLPQVNQIEVVENPSFLDKPEVSFSIVICDTLGNRQEVEYDGPVDGIDKVGSIIKSMTNGNGTEQDTVKSEN